MCSTDDSNYREKCDLAEAITTLAKILMYLIFGLALIGYLAPEVLVGLGLTFPWPSNSWIWVGAAALIVSTLVDNI